MAERRMPFNVSELQKVAAKALNKPVEDVKMLRNIAEGGFNRILEVTMDDGASILARLPYPLTVPRRLAVASEVATLDLLRANRIPVPRVLAYSTGKNDVSAEYMLMEKMPGKPLSSVWIHLTDDERFKILHQIVTTEATLFAMELPASGSIYYSHDLPLTMPRIYIPGFDNGLCIGPYAHSVWWYGERKDLDIDRGPHTNPQHVLRSFADKELAWIHAHGRPRYPSDREYIESFGYKKQDPEEHASSLEGYLRLVPYLVPADPTSYTPTLRRPDLTPNNILITDNLIVTGFIDWQHAMVLPAWLTAGIPPAFENHADEGSRGLQIPKLPDDLQSMDKTARARAEEQYRRRHIHFWYLALTRQLNEQHWRAYMGHDGAFITRNMFLQAGMIWQGNNAHLQIDLSQVVRNWSVFASSSADGSIPTCPVVIEEQEMQRRENLRISLQEGDAFRTNMSEMMGVLPDGSVSHENFRVAKERESMIREGVLTKLKDDPLEAKRVLLTWPFHDFDEDE
jgi:aminoglycoside phosphotransferase (APT) family kinase protein